MHQHNCCATPTATTLKPDFVWLDGGGGGEDKGGSAEFSLIRGLDHNSVGKYFASSDSFFRFKEEHKRKSKMK